MNGIDGGKEKRNFPISQTKEKLGERHCLSRSCKTNIELLKNQISHLSFFTWPYLARPILHIAALTRAAKRILIRFSSDNHRPPVGAAIFTEFKDDGNYKNRVFTEKY